MSNRLDTPAADRQDTSSAFTSINAGDLGLDKAPNLTGTFGAAAASAGPVSFDNNGTYKVAETIHLSDVKLPATAINADIMNYSKHMQNLRKPK